MSAQPNDRQRAAALLAIATDDIIELAADWTVTYVSDHGRSLFPPDAVGRSLWDVLGSRVSPEFRRECLQAMSTRQATEFSEFRPAAGCWSMVRVVPSGDGLLVSFRDIAEMKRHEVEMRDSWELTRNVLDALPLGVWLLDVSGTIIASNPAARRIWGGARYVCLDDIGQYVAWHHGTDTRIDAEQWGITRAIRTGESILDLEADIQTFDGKRKTIRYSAAPLREADGRIVGVITVNQEITTEKETQAALAQAWLEAKRANLARSRMVASLAHDLLQPLLAIRLHLTGILSEVRHKTAATLQTLIGSLQSVENLVEGLMENAALESGKITPQWEAVDLGELVGHVCCETGAIAAAKNLRLHCRPGRAATASTDPVLLQRALRNLVTNALRCTATGGVLVAVRGRPDHLAVEVWDTGPGFDRETLAQHLDDTPHPTQSPNGFGIGLRTVKTIARLLDLTLDARSAAGKGTVFRLRIPRPSV